MDQHTDPQPEGDHSPAAPDKPTTFQGDLRNLPPTLEPLKGKPNWVLWRWEFRGIKDGKKDWTKVPYQPNGSKVKGNDASTWSTYQACISAFDRGGFDGIGFCLLHSGFNAFDVDRCRDKKTGELKVQAKKLMERCGDTYAEVTVSGTGIRIIGLGVSAVDRQKKYPVGDGVSVEVYRCTEKGRYITISGKVIESHKGPLKNIDDAIDEVYDKCEAQRANGSFDETISGASFADTDEFENIEPDDPRLAGLSARWIELGHDGTGIAEQYGADRSRAVMAFATECFRAGIAEQILASLLMRWKIGEHIRDQSNVTRALNRTIDKAKRFVENSKLFEMNEKHCILPIGGNAPLCR